MSWSSGRQPPTVNRLSGCYYLCNNTKMDRSRLEFSVLECRRVFTSLLHLDKRPQVGNCPRKPIAGLPLQVVNDKRRSHQLSPSEPFIFRGNVGESGILFRRQCTYALDTNQRICHCPALIYGSNAIIYFIELVINP